MAARTASTIDNTFSIFRYGWSESADTVVDYSMLAGQINKVDRVCHSGAFNPVEKYGYDYYGHLLVRHQLSYPNM
jgi:hypothetical protein